MWLLSIINKRFGAEPIEDCDAVALQLYLNQLAKTHSSSLVKHIRILLKSIMADAVDADFLRKNPARLLRVPAALRPVIKPYLTVEQVAALLSHAKGRDRLILRLLLVTGMRPSELFALRYRSLDVEQGLLRITESVYRGVVRPFSKTTDENSPKHLTQVFLPQELIVELVAFRTLEDGYPNDFIFSSSTLNTPLLKENWQQRNLNPIAKAAGIPRVNFQILRRTCATHMQNLGSPTSVASVLRHTKVSTSLDNYVQPQAEATKDVVDKLTAMLLPRV
jgi:integrase